MRYYCHQCRLTIDPDDLLPDFTCPRCRSGFIEEMPQMTRRSSSTESNRSSLDESGNMRANDDYSDYNSDDFNIDGPLAQVLGLIPRMQQSNQAPTSTPARQPTDESTSASNAATSDTNRSPGRENRLNTIMNQSDPGIVELLNSFVSGAAFNSYFPSTSGPRISIQGGGPGQGTAGPQRNFFNIDFPMPITLHSNPGDYAWGNSGFDAIITQLLNNLDGNNNGVPPMPKESIDNLRTIKISDEQVKNGNLQCSVCMDDFQVGDLARELACEHFFHENCIIPWLELHASCPVCRKTFTSDTNTPSTTSTSNQPQRPNPVGSNPDSNSIPSHDNQTPSSSTHRSDPTSSTIVINLNTRPREDYQEDECD